MQLSSQTASLAAAGLESARKFRALVVSNNITTGIVAAAIVEKCGLAVERTDHDGALQMLGNRTPLLLILDDGCFSLTELLETTDSARPYTIGLGVTDADDPQLGKFDTFVRKPLTTDRLQPVIFQYLENYPCANAL